MIEQACDTAPRTNDPMWGLRLANRATDAWLIEEATRIAGVANRVNVLGPELVEFYGGPKVVLQMEGAI